MAGNKKNSTARNYSFIGLILALLACIATFLIGVTRGLVAMQMFTVCECRQTSTASADQRWTAHPGTCRLRDHGARSESAASLPADRHATVPIR